MKMTKDKQVDFWDNFVANVWQKESKVLESVFDQDLMSEDDAFTVLLNSLETYVMRKGTRASIKIFLDGTPVTPVECHTQGLIPELKDKNFDGYFSRIKPALKDREFCVVLDRGELLPQTRDKVYGLLRNVYSRLGYIAPDSFAFFFFGQYTKTPFGAHIHDCQGECDATFIVSINGEKNIWVWEEGYEEHHPQIVGARDVEAHISESTKLTATPGKMIYFPSYQLHIGESAVKDSFNLFIAVKPAADAAKAFYGYFDFHLEDYFAVNEVNQKRTILNALASRFESTVANIKIKERDNARLAVDFDQMQQSANQLPKELDDAAQLLVNYLPKELVELMAIKFWLAVLTSFGLVSRSTIKKKPSLLNSQHIKVLDNHPLLWGQHQQYLIVAAAGHTWEFEHKPIAAVAAMIEKLHQGESLNVGELIEMATETLSDTQRNTAGRSDFIEVLDQLNGIGIFEVID